MENKIGVCDFSFPGGGLLGIEMAGRAGYQGLQIADASSLAEGFPLLNPYIRDRYLETAAQYGLVFQGLNLAALCYANIMGSPLDSSQGAVIQTCLKNAVKVCQWMDIHVIMLNVNNIHFIAKPSPEIMQNIKATLQYANRLCQENGIVVSIETCIPPRMFHQLREEVGENIKICFDIANPVYHGIGEPFQLISEYGLDAIDHFHIKDFKAGYFGYLTQDSEMCYPGEGGCGFEKCAEVINQGRFKGWLISESIFTMPGFRTGGTGETDYIAAGAKDVEIIRRHFCV